MVTRGSWDALRARLAREHTILVSVIVLYVLAAKAGLGLASLNGVASLVWPASGIALGAFIILGYRIWPAIIASALVAYVSTLGLSPTAIALAATDTCEALFAAYLVNRYASGRHALQRPRDSLRFAGVVLLAGTIVGATFGSLSLVAGKLAFWSDYGSIWLAFGLGKIVGMMLVAPPILMYSQGSVHRWKPKQVVEVGCLISAVLVVGLVGFYRFPVELRGFPQELLCMPVLLWASFRLGQRTAAAALLVLAVIVIFGTLHGYGPFVRATPFASLTIVQIFMAITAVMTLALAALVSEYSAADAQLRELVVTDPLTGMANYRRLLEVLHIEIARADRHGRAFAVVFFDMDGLKRINDEFGHLTGSRAVCRFAEVLRASCRETDTPARYGGDEFVAVLPDTDPEGARHVVRRVTERLDTDTDQPQLSASAGIALYPKDGGTPTTLLSAADRALYVIKAEKAGARRRGVLPLREWSNVGSG